jgi:hypothetical protein
VEYVISALWHATEMHPNHPILDPSKSDEVNTQLKPIQTGQPLQLTAAKEPQFVSFLCILIFFPCFPQEKNLSFCRRFRIVMANGNK